MNAMPPRSFCCIAFRRLQFRHVGGFVSSRIRGGEFECLSKVCLGQRRPLLTAVTSSPKILTKYSDDIQPPATILPTIVDSGLAWASQKHNPDDPPAHAMILISKALIPRGKTELLGALGKSTRLCGLNALVGVVDTVGEGAKGVSVLLGSRSEAITIHTLDGLPIEALRVGKWHAKDEEKSETIDFDHVLASMRGETASGTPIPARPDSSATKDLVFVLGEMEAVNNQATAINQKFPAANIVWSHYAELTEDGPYTCPDTND